MIAVIACLTMISPHAEAYSVVDLGVLPGTSNSSATGINDSGQIVGELGDGYYEGDRAVLWDKTGIHDLTASGVPGTANAINGKGWIVGAVGERDHPRAYIWREGRAVQLSGLAGKDSRAYGVNDRGDVVGVAGRIMGGAIWGHLFLWRAGHVTVLDVQPENEGAETCGIDGRGDVVGMKGYGTGADSYYAHSRRLVWAHGTLALLNRDDRLGGIRGVDSRGNYVGSANFGQAEEDGSTQYHAILGRGSTAVDLNRRIPAKSGWVLLEATGINDKGEIVGFGRHRGLNRAFLLRPVSHKK